MATPAIRLHARDSDHLIALLENLEVTLEQRRQRATERVFLARALGAYVGQARALEAAETYEECRRLIVSVLHG